MISVQKAGVILAGVVLVCSKPESQKHLSGLYTGPYFSPGSVSNLTVSLGETVHLPCRVKQVGTNSVAWVRNRDSSILSIEEDTIVRDHRFLAVTDQHRGEWTLIIRNVTNLDDGSYECQISTQSKMSHFVYLKVLVPTVIIEGAPDIFAKSGSKVELLCTVTDHGLSTSRILWLKEGKVIKKEEWPDMEILMREEEGKIISILTIKNLIQKRFGSYSCSPGGLESSSVNLHVTDAKEQGLRTNLGNDHPSSPFLCLLLPSYLFIARRGHHSHVAVI